MSTLAVTAASLRRSCRTGNFEPPPCPGSTSPLAPRTANFSDSANLAPETELFPIFRPLLVIKRRIWNPSPGGQFFRGDRISTRGSPSEATCGLRPKIFWAETACPALSARRRSDHSHRLPRRSIDPRSCFTSGYPQMILGFAESSWGKPLVMSQLQKEHSKRYDSD